MKIRKLKGDLRWKTDTADMCRMIGALRTAREAAYGETESGEFQARCRKAIIAIADELLKESVERFYKPEETQFDVKYGVVRKGTHTMKVSARSEEDAKAIAQATLDGSHDLDKLATEVETAEVMSVQKGAGDAR